MLSSGVFHHFSKKNAAESLMCVYMQRWGGTGWQVGLRWQLTAETSDMWRQTRLTVKVCLQHTNRTQLNWTTVLNTWIPVEVFRAHELAERQPSWFISAVNQVVTLTCVTSVRVVVKLGRLAAGQLSLVHALWTSLKHAKLMNEQRRRASEDGRRRCYHQAYYTAKRRMIGCMAHGDLTIPRTRLPVF